jgi:hypothetical protein
MILTRVVVNTGAGDASQRATITLMQKCGMEFVEAFDIQCNDKSGATLYNFGDNEEYLKKMIVFLTV